MSFCSASPALTKDDVERFSRQIMVEGIGAEGMAKIRQARVVCIGAGGLGSTIGLYLAAAGVGTLVFVDGDDVEVSNLHRQVIHTNDRLGVKKVQSAKQSCLALFPAARIEAVAVHMSPENAESIICGCDVVVDGSDNVAARYLVNDVAMRRGIPLVSGSAMRCEGQLAVYGLRDGPCYRCLFPVPPPPAAVGSCNDAGVLGPVPGMIGCLQALEVLKVICGAGEVLSGRMFLFDGMRFTARVVRLRGKQPGCPACGAEARASTVPFTALTAARPEYLMAPCAVGAAYSQTRLEKKNCCSPVDFARARAASLAALREAVSTARAGPLPTSWSLCVDVRAALQFGMAHLPGSFSLPLQTLQSWAAADVLASEFENFLVDAVTKDIAQSMAGVAPPETLPHNCTCYIICRRGVASTQAVELLQPVVATTKERPFCVSLINVDGGLNAYHRQVDSSFPYY